jgi:hypothetical protein
MFVNENGLKLELPVNVRASEIYWNNLKVHDPNLLAIEMTLRDPKPIAGTAVLFKDRICVAIKSDA